MKINVVSVLMVLFIFSVCSLNVSAGDYIDGTYVTSGYTGYVNESGVLRLDTVYTWGLNITGTNVTGVTLNGHALTNASDLANNESDWSVALLPSQVASFQNNCSFTTFSFTTINVNSTGTAFTNISSQANVTIIPCIETSSATATMSTTDIDTMDLTVADSTATDSVLWLKGLSFNVTNTSCYYGCSNAQQCKVSQYIIGGVASEEYCILEVNRSTVQVGVVAVDVDQSTSTVAPSNIPAALAGAVATLITVAAVSRVKRRGSTREA